MLTLGSNRKLIESVSELPDFSTAENLYMDFETGQFGSVSVKKHQGMYPFLGDRICGIAVTADNYPDAYYIPIRHRRTPDRNLPLDSVQRWLALQLTCKNWVNHNIKFDAMFAHFDKADFQCRLVDTLPLSKMIDTDRLSHGLKDLRRDFLGYDEPDKDRVDAFLKSARTSDHSEVPIDIEGDYACGDVLSNRDLYLYLLRNRPSQIERVWETEILLTPVLFDMELEGLTVDPAEINLQNLTTLYRLIELSERISKIADREWTNSSDCVYDILCQRFGLPVLATKWQRNEDGFLEDTGRPTFDAAALEQYQIHPSVLSHPKILELVNLICEYREHATFKGLFLDTFAALADGTNRIHPSYNQVVRTGRMSASRPGIQQQNKRSKALIHPDPGHGFFSNDYSQIEYRLIVHYCQDEDAIRAYNEDPRTDFHEWVAGQIHANRDAAKRINFGMAYGMGKKSTTRNLAKEPEIIAEISEMVTSMVKEGAIPSSHAPMLFKELVSRRASEVYVTYHEKFPRIKSTSDQAKNNCLKRGYVFNAYGRRRHLPPKASRKAFNSVVQGCAMDIMKERMVALSPRYNPRSRELGLTLKANVHDEVLTQVPLEHLADPAVHGWLCDLLEQPSIPFKVPIATGMGYSSRSWAEAGAKGAIMEDGVQVGGKIR